MQKNKLPANRVECPIEYIMYAIRNPELFAQEFLSFPSGAVNPFFREIDRVIASVSEDRPNPLNEEDYTFADWWTAPDDLPRYAHVDLARNHDAVGISMCHTKGTVNIERVSNQDGTAMKIEKVDLPFIEFDFAGRLKARKHLGERGFDYKQIINIFTEIDRRGFNIKNGIITFDRFQSDMLMDAMRDLGFICALLSVDHTTRKAIVDFSKPHYYRHDSVHGQPAIVMMDFREMISQGRVQFPQIPAFDEQMDWLVKEAMEAMWNPDKQKVFKMEVSGASDDLLQSVAGAAFNCQVNVEDDILPQINAKPNYDTDDWYDDMDGFEDENTVRRGVNVRQNDMGFYEDDFDLYGDSVRMGAAL